MYCERNFIHKIANLSLRNKVKSLANNKIILYAFEDSFHFLIFNFKLKQQLQIYKYVCSFNLFLFAFNEK